MKHKLKNYIHRLANSIRVDEKNLESSFHRDGRISMGNFADYDFPVTV